MSVERTSEWYKFEDRRPTWLRGKYGLLSDRDIRRCLEEGIIKIEPLDLDKLDKAIKNSFRIDFHLGNIITTFKKTHLTVMDSREEIPRELQQDIVIRDDEFFVLHPGDFVLAETKERLVLPDFIAGRIEGRSYWARRGVSIEEAAGFDAGWDGVPTLELKHNGIVAQKLWPWDRICAFSFQLLTTPAMNPYSGRYKNQSGPKA